MDWQSLTDKLKRMGVQVGVEKPLQQPSEKRRDISELLPGHEVSNIFGSLFSSRHTYPLTYQHGSQAIVPKQTLEKIATWANSDAPETIQLHNLVFLDTETTGLSGGTGTLAFMVGAARFIGDELVLEQFFLRNPAEETAMVAALAEFCDGMQAVVTYNGKSFDIPILNTRFILQSMRSPFAGLLHFDLLHLTRKVWRARLEQCRLGNIEQQILGLERDANEIPGYLVPEFYNQYLRDGNAEPLLGVFYHNEVDVVSLAALFAYFCDLLGDPNGWQSNEIKDLTSVGRLIESMGDSVLAEAIYNRGYDTESPSEHRLELLLRKAMLHKRNAQFEQAVHLWEEASEFGSLEALLELAKYHEHVHKNPQLALEVSSKALTILSMCEVENKQLQISVWEHRVQRLTAKRNKSR